MQQNIANILLLVSSIVALGTALVVYLADKKNISYRFLAFSLIGGAIWAGSIFFTILTGNLGIGHLAFMGTTIMLGAFLYFILYFSELYTKKWGYALGIPLVLVAVSTVIDNSIVREFDYTQGYLMVIKQGPFYWPYFIFNLLGIVVLVYLLIKSTKIVSGIKRLQLLYINTGLIIAVTIGFIFNLLLPTLQIYHLTNLGPVFVIFMGAGMVYAATKHYIYDRQVVISELLALILVLISIVWLVTNLTFFNIVLVILVVNICFLFARSVVSEAQKKIILLQQKAQLEQDKAELQKLDELKDDFLQMAQHELNSPIALIEGKLSMIVDEGLGGFNEKQREYLKPLYLDARRLARLSKELVDVSQIDQGQIKLMPETVDMDQTIKKTLTSFTEMAKKKNIAIEYIEPVVKMPTVKYDPYKLKQILQTLISNAIKFTQNGKITIELEKNDKYLIISVMDTGIGIEKEDQEHIFEKFFQAGRFSDVPQEQQGTGLSLYIAKKLIEMQGGKIYLESAKNRGSKFFFTVPLAW